MDLDNLNQELLSLQKDYTQFQHNTDINFQDPSNLIKTDQIKRATRSGDHRLEFNDRLTNLNMQSIYPQEAPNFMIQPPLQSRHDNQSYTNNFANNFEAKHPFKQQQAISDYHLQFQTQLQNDSQKINPNLNKYNEFGYDKPQITKNNVDYRQNMNNKLDHFIFDSAGHNIQPLIQPNICNNFIDHRVQLQDSSRSLYRDQANERMTMYSPLSRAANIPISLFGSQDSNINQTNITTTKDILSERMSNYTPLSSTIPFNTKTNNKDEYVKSLSQLDQQLKQIKNKN
jgi:hypothetical protein